MNYGVIVTVQDPIDTYDALHRELLEVTSGDVDGLITHIARAHGTGFQVIEVWESKEQYEHYNRDVVWPMAARVSGPRLTPTAPVVEEFEPRGLVIPNGEIAR